MFCKPFSWRLNLAGLRKKDNESRYKELCQNAEFRRLMRLVANKHAEEIEPLMTKVTRF